MSSGVCSGSRCIVSVGSLLGQHCLTFYPQCVCEPLRALWLGVTLPPIGSRCRRCGNRGVERAGRRGRSITRCDPLQSGMFSMDIQPNMSMHVCACVAETGGEEMCSQSDTGLTNRQVDRIVDTHKHLFFNAQSFFVNCVLLHSCKQPVHTPSAKARSSWFESRCSAHLLLAPERSNIWQHSEPSSPALGLRTELASSTVAYCKGKLSAGPFKVPNHKH